MKRLGESNLSSLKHHHTTLWGKPGKYKKQLENWFQDISSGPKGVFF